MNKIARIKEIQQEVFNTPKPVLNSSSLEDWDDLAQAKLEWGWWKREIEEEYNELIKDTNYPSLKFR